VEIIAINLVLTFAVLAFGLWIFSQTRSHVAALIGLAFGLFAASHLIDLLGMAAELSVVIIVIRILAYLLALIALYRIWKG
jgi:hypothetical protein